MYLILTQLYQIDFIIVYVMDEPIKARKVKQVLVFSRETDTAINTHIYVCNSIMYIRVHI